MKVEVRYYSRGGNTEKLARAIADAVGVPALTVTEPLTEDTDLLFLGSAVYAAGVDDEVKRFIEGIDVRVGRVVNFSTAAFIKSTYKTVERLLREKDIPMDPEEFACRGAFAFLHKGKPDEADQKAAAAFAKRMLEKTP